MNYKQKYEEYKAKYLALKNKNNKDAKSAQFGGSNPENNDNESRNLQINVNADQNRCNEISDILKNFTSHN